MKRSFVCLGIFVFLSLPSLVLAQVCDDQGFSDCADGCPQGPGYEACIDACDAAFCEVPVPTPSPQPDDRTRIERLLDTTKDFIETYPWIFEILPYIICPMLPPGGAPQPPCDEPGQYA